MRSDSIMDERFDGGKRRFISSEHVAHSTVPVLLTHDKPSSNTAVALLPKFHDFTVYRPICVPCAGLSYFPSNGHWLPIMIPLIDTAFNSNSVYCLLTWTICAVGAPCVCGDVQEKT
jgi:hypothetical protein